VHTEHWREPFDRSNGLLMEFVHLLTQGRRMRDVIAEQLADLEQRLGVRGLVVREALRYIATAHGFGGYLSRATLARLVAGGEAPGLGRTLN